MFERKPDQPFDDSSEQEPDPWGSQPRFRYEDPTGYDDPYNNGTLDDQEFDQSLEVDDPFENLAGDTMTLKVDAPKTDTAEAASHDQVFEAASDTTNWLADLTPIAPPSASRFLKPGDEVTSAHANL